MKDKCIRNKNLKSNKSRRIFFSFHSIFISYTAKLLNLSVSLGIISCSQITCCLRDWRCHDWFWLTSTVWLSSLNNWEGYIYIYMFFLLMLFLNASYFFVSKFNCFYRLRIHDAVYHPFESDFKIVQPMMISWHMYFEMNFWGD